MELKFILLLKYLLGALMLMAGQYDIHPAVAQRFRFGKLSRKLRTICSIYVKVGPAKANQKLNKIRVTLT